MKITLSGTLKGFSAYPIINRALAKAFSQAHELAINEHTLEGELTNLYIEHVYPPRPNVLKHNINVALTAWEFLGEYPKVKGDNLNTFDFVGVPSANTAEQLSQQLKTKVFSLTWGVNKPAQLVKPNGKTTLLWLGGTDPRHGLHLLPEIANFLPDDIDILAKINTSYPLTPAMLAALDHPRITILNQDIPNLSDFWAKGSVYLHTALGVGFSLPVLEAIAHGLPVVSSPLPQVLEFNSSRIFYTEIDATEIQKVKHHIFTKTNCAWFVTDPQAYIKPILAALSSVFDVKSLDEFLAKYTWEKTVKDILDATT